MQNENTWYVAARAREFDTGTAPFLRILTPLPGDGLEGRIRWLKYFGLTPENNVANLGAYLLDLERNVTERGGYVHWATDANDANQIVINVVKSKGASSVVKVKSMATQEIGLE